MRCWSIDWSPFLIFCICKKNRKFRFIWNNSIFQHVCLVFKIGSTISSHVKKLILVHLDSKEMFGYQSLATLSSCSSFASELESIDLFEEKKDFSPLGFKRNVRPSISFHPLSKQNMSLTSSSAFSHLEDIKLFEIIHNHSSCFLKVYSWAPFQIYPI